jgi:hypothetical protein
MHSAGARALREDDNQMSREAVLLQWERKIEVAERLEDDGAEVTQLRPSEQETPRRGRFERSTPERSSTPEPSAPTEPAPAPAEPARRTITITGQPERTAPAPMRRSSRPLVDAQLARPDRIALWAFLLGLLLVAVAAGTAHA